MSGLQLILTYLNCLREVHSIMLPHSHALNVVMLRFPNFDFRSISIQFLAQNHHFDSTRF